MHQMLRALSMDQAVCRSLKEEECKALSFWRLCSDRRNGQLQYGRRPLTVGSVLDAPGGWMGTDFTEDVTFQLTCRNVKGKAGR